MEPISRNRTNLLSLSNQPFSFPVTFPYFSPYFSPNFCPLFSFVSRAVFDFILVYFFLEYFPGGQRSSSNVLSHFFLFREETLLCQYSGQLAFAVSRLVYVLFFIFSVFLFIIYYLKKLSYASSIYILNPSCYLVGSVETSVISLVLTSSGNYICHKGSATLLHLWKILHLVRHSSVS